jgi:hypothetical protein
LAKAMPARLNPTINPVNISEFVPYSVLQSQKDAAENLHLQPTRLPLQN